MIRLQSLVGIVCSLVLASTTLAQVSSVIVRVNVPVVSQNQQLPVGVEFTPSSGVERVMLKYRGYGESEFVEQEMLLAGNSATLTIAPQYILPPYIEYYVEVSLSGGRTETHPLQNP